MVKNNISTKHVTIVIFHTLMLSNTSFNVEIKYARFTRFLTVDMLQQYSLNTNNNDASYMSCRIWEF